MITVGINQHHSGSLGSRPAATGSLYVPHFQALPTSVQSPQGVPSHLSCKESKQKGGIISDLDLDI